MIRQLYFLLYTLENISRVRMICKLQEGPTWNASQHCCDKENTRFLDSNEKHVR